MDAPVVLRKCKYAFLTLPNYSLIAVANALEPLRMANRVVGREVYEWSVISVDGHATDASSGLALSPTGALDMGGNVSELVKGFFDAEGTLRLAKGGSFAKKAPVWERIPVTGADRSIGFRCARPIR